LWEAVRGGTATTAMREVVRSIKARSPQHQLLVEVFEDAGRGVVPACLVGETQERKMARWGGKRWLKKVFLCCGTAAYLTIVVRTTVWRGASSKGPTGNRAPTKGGSRPAKRRRTRTRRGALVRDRYFRNTGRVLASWECANTSEMEWGSFVSGRRQRWGANQKTENEAGL
jgi:hypothetical protein